MGASGLTWVDLDAFCRVNSETLSGFDLELIRTIDRAYLDLIEEQNDKTKKAEERKHAVNTDKHRRR